MKQFMVLCAILPLMLIIIVQMTMEQTSNYKINNINQIVYTAKERAQQEGYFSDEIKSDLLTQLDSAGFDLNFVQTEYDDYDSPQNLGSILNYKVTVRIENALIELLAGQSSYDYVIDSCTVSQCVLIQEAI